MPMTHNDSETEPSGRRTFLWKGRSPRATQQQQLLQPTEFTNIGSSSDVSYFNGYADTISIPSRTSSDHPGDIGTDKNTMAMSEQVDSEDFREYFTQVPLDDPLLQEFHCTLRNDPLVHGQLFITKSFLCFKSTTSDHPTTKVEFKIGNIKLIDLVRPGRWKPRMIQITLKNDAKYTFTAFLPSTTSRDEAYQCLMEIWKPLCPPITSSSSSSTPTLSTHLPSAMTTISKEGDESDTTTTTTSDNNKSNDSLTTTTPITPAPAPAPAGPFKLFQRKRAQTVTAQIQQEPPKTGSATSFSTPLGKSLNAQIIWNDGQPHHIQSSEPDPPKILSSSPPSLVQQPQQQPPSALKNKKKRLPSATVNPLVPPPEATTMTAATTQTSAIRISTRTLLMIAGFLLLVSHAFLTYEFYHMTHLLTTTRQIQKQQQTVSSLQQQRNDVSWLSDQLEKAAIEAQRWEKETMQQKRQLMNMIPS